MAYVIVSGRSLPEGEDWDQFCMPYYELEDHEIPEIVDMCNRMAELSDMPAPPTFAQVVHVADREPALRADLFFELFYHARRRGGCRMTDATIAQDEHFVDDFVVQCHLLQTLWRDDGVAPEFEHLDNLSTQDQIEVTCRDMRRTFARLYAKAAPGTPPVADIVSAFNSDDEFKASVALHVMRALYVLRRAPLGLEDTLMNAVGYDPKLLADAKATAIIYGRVSPRRRSRVLVASCDASDSRLYAFKALPVLFEPDERGVLPTSELAATVSGLAETLRGPRRPEDASSEWERELDNGKRLEAMRVCKRVLLEVLLVTGDVTVDIAGERELTELAEKVRDYKREMYNCVKERVSVWLGPHPSHLVVALVAEKASVKPGLAFMKHMRDVPPRPPHLKFRDSVKDATHALLPPQGR